MKRCESAAKGQPIAETFMPRYIAANELSPFVADVDPISSLVSTAVSSCRIRICAIVLIGNCFSDQAICQLPEASEGLEINVCKASARTLSNNIDIKLALITLLWGWWFG